MSHIKLPHTVTLLVPVEVGDGVIESVTFARRPVAGDMRGVKLDDLSDVNKAMTVICRITDLPVAAKTRVDFADAVELTEVIAGFLETGR